MSKYFRKKFIKINRENLLKIPIYKCKANLQKQNGGYYEITNQI